MIENEAVQETAYAILALNSVDRSAFANAIHGAADYLLSVQLPSGGWEGYVGSGENNEITGEALWALSVVYPAEVWVSYNRKRHERWEHGAPICYHSERDK